MIVISKKKIQVIILCLMISILTVAITIGNDSKNTKMVNSENIEKIVILDPGHGIPDVGVSLLHKVKNKSNYSFIKN